MENYKEKPAREQQWQEKGTNPILTKRVTIKEIHEFREAQAASYNTPDHPCKPEDIKITYEMSEEDVKEGRYDFAWCVFSMEREDRETGVKMDKAIFHLKVPVPEKVKETLMRRYREKKEQEEKLITKVVDDGEVPAPPPEPVGITPVVEEIPEVPAVPKKTAKKGGKGRKVNY